MEGASTVLISKASVDHMGLIKVVHESPCSTFEFQFTLWSNPFWSWIESSTRVENNFLVLHIDFIFIPDTVGSYFESNPAFPWLSFLSPLSFLFHTASNFIISSSSFLTLRCPLSYITQNRTEWKEMKFLISKTSIFSLSHTEMFCSTICKFRGAPFLHFYITHQ